MKKIFLDIISFWCYVKTVILQTKRIKNTLNTTVIVILLISNSLLYD